MQPAAQLARPHRRGSRIKHPGERQRVIAREALVELEVAPSRRVHQQRVRVLLDIQGSQVWQRGFLRFLYIGEQGAGGADRKRQARAPEPCQVMCAKLFGQGALRRCRIELPRRPQLPPGRRRQQCRCLRGNKFRRPQAFKLGIERRLAVEFRDTEAPRGEIEPSEAESSV